MFRFPYTASTNAVKVYVELFAHEMKTCEGP